MSSKGDAMTKYEMMDELTVRSGGYLLSSEVQNAGISRTYLSEYVKERELERIEAGIYILPDVWPDYLYTLQLKNREIVYSNETALYLHGLMEREPGRICVAVKRGYNADHLIRRGVKPYYVRHALFNLGVTNEKTMFGNQVRVYDVERTICDVIHRKDEMDIQIFQTALKEYMSGSRKNLHRLMEYAQQMGLEDKIRIYTEVLI